MDVQVIDQRTLVGVDDDTYESGAIAGDPSGARRLRQSLAPDGNALIDKSRSEFCGAHQIEISTLPTRGMQHANLLGVADCRFSDHAKDRIEGKALA